MTMRIAGFLLILLALAQAGCSREQPGGNKDKDKPVPVDKK